MRSNSLVFLGVGHAYDHLFMLLYATAVLGLGDTFDLPYGELLTLATPGFIAFGAGALPAGWLGDRWSRRRMLAIFFFGLGGAAVLTGLATSTWALMGGLTAIGVFASIYHPVGIAMVVEGREAVGRALAINGIFGNLGVAGAALVAGFLLELGGWRVAFIIPGCVALATGVAYVALTRESADGPPERAAGPIGGHARHVLIRVFGVIAISALLGGLIFDATTIALPKLLEERLVELDLDLSGIGAVAAALFAMAALAQYVVGSLIDRVPIKPVFVLLEAIQAPVLILVGLAYGWTALALAFTMMLLVFGEIPISDTLVARYTVPEWRSRVYALKNLLNLGVSAVAVPLIGVLHERGGGFETLFVVLGTMAALVAVAALLLPRAAAPGRAKPLRTAA